MQGRQGCHGDVTKRGWKGGRDRHRDLLRVSEIHKRYPAAVDTGREITKKADNQP